MKQIEQEQIEYETKLEHLQEKRKTINGNSINATAAFNRRVEAYLKKLNLMMMEKGLLNMQM